MLGFPPNCFFIKLLMSQREGRLMLCTSVERNLMRWCAESLPSALLPALASERRPCGLRPHIAYLVPWLRVFEEQNQSQGIRSPGFLYVGLLKLTLPLSKAFHCPCHVTLSYSCFSGSHAFFHFKTNSSLLGPASSGVYPHPFSFSKACFCHFN